MNFCTKIQKIPEMLAQFTKKLYLCIRISELFALESMEGSLGEWLKPPVC